MRRTSCRLEKRKNPLPTIPQQGPQEHYLTPRKNSILCEARLRCADVSRDVCERLDINSCSRCDLFSSRITLKKQHEVCQRRFGCRREVDASYLDLPIKVRVCWSAGRNHSKKRNVERCPNHLTEVQEKNSLSARKRAALIGHAKRKLDSIEKIMKKERKRKGRID